MKPVDLYPNVDIVAAIEAGEMQRDQDRPWRAKPVCGACGQRGHSRNRCKR